MTRIGQVIRQRSSNQFWPLSSYFVNSYRTRSKGNIPKAKSKPWRLSNKHFYITEQFFPFLAFFGFEADSRFFVHLPADVTRSPPLKIFEVFVSLMVR